MRRELKGNCTLYKQNLYPFLRKKESKLPYNALIGIGGNIGDVKRRFNHLFIYLQRSPFIEIIESSPILKNPPFGYLNQNYFFNSLLYIKTSLQPKELLRYVLRVEKKFGRKRLFPNAPRSLDIDIIFFEERVINTKRLIIPHPFWKERDSVLIPMDYMKSLYIKKKVNI
jgi:2-amino-4-hydroxy-6-hydroxymethyldihydropteridine diphosphokinase